MNGDQDSLQRSVMLLMAEYQLFDCDITWDTKLNFAVICNDLFWWGSADAESITEESITELEQALKDSDEIYGCLLYCCRMRKMRPQGAYYKHIDKEFRPLFNACGSERETGLGNPEAVKEKDL